MEMEAVEYLIQQTLNMDRGTIYDPESQKNMDEDTEQLGDKPYPYSEQPWEERQDIYRRRWFSSKQASILCEQPVHVASGDDLEEIAKQSLATFRKHMNDNMPINVRVGNFKFTEKVADATVEAEVRWGKCSFVAERKCHLKADGKDAQRVKFLAAVALIEGIKALPCVQEFASKVINKEGHYIASALPKNDFKKMFKKKQSNFPINNMNDLIRVLKSDDFGYTEDGGSGRVYKKSNSVFEIHDPYFYTPPEKQLNHMENDWNATGSYGKYFASTYNITTRVKSLFLVESRKYKGMHGYVKMQVEVRF